MLCVPMNVINPFFNKAFERFTVVLYGIAGMMANVVVNVQKLRALLRNNFLGPPLHRRPPPPDIIGAVTKI